MRQRTGSIFNSSSEVSEEQISSSSDTTQDVIQLFTLAVQKYPCATAVSFANCSYTYEELDCRSNQFAHWLLLRGISKGDIVVTSLQPCIDLHVVILGIFKIGAIYVPVDPSYPAQKTDEIVSLVESSLFVGTQQDIEHSLSSSVEYIHLPKAIEEASILPTTERSIDLDSQDVAYIFFTSGTTGRPKGVVATHENLSFFVQSANKKYAFEQKSIFCSIARYTFSISWFELLCPLVLGAQVQLLERSQVLDPASLEIVLRQVSILHAGPSLLRVLLKYMSASNECIRSFDNIKHLSSGGDVVSLDLLASLRPWFPKAEIFIIYGCTEIACMGCTYEYSSHPKTGQENLIGKPFENNVVHLQPVNEDDEHGDCEIWVSGDGVAKGYFKQQELTKQKFVEKNGRIFYRTGDLGRYTEDHNIAFLGRQDFQVQLHGVRIELSAIDNALRSAPGVLDAVSVAIEQQLGEKIVVAYVVKQNNEININDLREHISQTLTDDMQPSVFIFLDKLPTNANLKIDRAALPVPTRDDVYPNTLYVAPQTESQIVLSKKCASLLGLEKLGLDDALGANINSLLALSINSHVLAQFGVKFSLQDLYADHNTVRVLAQTLDQLRQVQISNINNSQIDIYDNQTYYPLSSAQMRIWFADQVSGEAKAYNVPLLLEIRGSVDEVALKRAFQRLIEATPTLRTQLVDLNPVCQTIVPTDKFQFELETLFLQPEQVSVELKNRSQIPFQLYKEPLFRAILIHIQDRPSLLFINIHHVIFDARSIPVLVRRLEDSYTGKQLKINDWQYRNYVAYEKSQDHKDISSQQLVYWTQLFSSAPTPLDLPLDYLRPSKKEALAATISVKLSTDLCRKLRQQRQQSRQSTFTLVMSAWAALLYKLTQQNDIVIGTACSQRSHPQTDDLVGCFINLLPLRLGIDSQTSSQELFEQVHNSTLEALDHADVPFDVIVREVKATPNASTNPLFQTLVIEESLEDVVRSDDTLKLHQVFNSLSGALTDLTLWLRHDDSAITFALSYDVSLFKPTTAENILNRLVIILNNMLCDDKLIAELSLLSSDDREKLKRYNNTIQPLPQKNLLAQFKEQVLLNPGHIAVKDKYEGLTYQQLDEQSTHLAYALITEGVTPTSSVGISVPRDNSLIVSILAIFKAGASYVPLDPDYPSERILYMVDNSNISHVICTHQTEVSLPNHLRKIYSETRLLDTQPILPGISSKFRAYTIYTSGSTGKPKGVEVSHENLLNFLLAMQSAFTLSSKDVLVSVTTLNFDISVLELLLPIVSGACVLIADKESKEGSALRDLIIQNQATLLQATPTTWRLLVAAMKNAPEQKLPQGFKALCGGEVLPSDLAEALLQLDVELWNMYGPTETTVWSSYAKITDSHHINIGKPIANTSFYVLDEQLNRLPFGVAGELYIGGLGVTMGYKSRPDLTAERFLPDPYQETPGSIIYKTGDKVVQLADGSFVCLGRLDHQVKIRGYRIELSEIENAARSIEQISDCAVIVESNNSGHKKLQAYVAGDKEKIESLGYIGIMEALRQSLPAYMIPQEFFYVDALPRLPNGKINRKVLTNHKSDPLSHSQFDIQTEAGALELEIARVFASALEKSNLGIHDDFFRAGGHSLLAVQVSGQLQDLFGLNIPVSLLFEHSTPADVAQQLSNPGLVEPHPVLLNQNGEGQNLFCLGGINIYKPLAENLQNICPVYGVYVAQELFYLEDAQHNPSVEDLANEYIELILEVQPKGPYNLAGVSFGGLVAYEVARIMHQRNLGSANVILFDSVLPSAGRSYRKILNSALRLASLPTEDALQVVKQRVKRKVAKVKAKGEARFQAQQFDNIEVQSLHDNRAVASRNAAYHFAKHIGQYHGPISLIVAEKRLAEDPLADVSCGWSRVTTNLDIIKVDAHHLSLLQEPKVQDVAGYLKSRVFMRDN